MYGHDQKSSKGLADASKRGPAVRKDPLEGQMLSLWAHQHPSVQMRRTGSRRMAQVRAKIEARRAEIQARAATSSPHSSGTDSIQQAAHEGVRDASSPLPHLERIQQSFGHHDVTGVQAKVGGSARAASEAIGAEAYATGNRVAFRQSPDLHTAAHEAAHVVQQRSGKVQLDGGVGQVGDRYEQHADAVADAVVGGKSAEGLLNSFVGQQPSTATQQSSAGIQHVQRSPVQLEADANKESPGEKDADKASESKDDKEDNPLVPVSWQLDYNHTAKRKGRDTIVASSRVPKNQMGFSLKLVPDRDPTTASKRPTQHLDATNASDDGAVEIGSVQLPDKVGGKASASVKFQPHGRKISLQIKGKVAEGQSKHAINQKISELKLLPKALDEYGSEALIENYVRDKLGDMLGEATISVRGLDVKAPSNQTFSLPSQRYPEVQGPSSYTAEVVTSSEELRGKYIRKKEVVAENGDNEATEDSLQAEASLGRENVHEQGEGNVNEKGEGNVNEKNKSNADRTEESETTKQARELAFAREKERMTNEASKQVSSKIAEMMYTGEQTSSVTVSGGTGAQGQWGYQLAIDGETSEIPITMFAPQKFIEEFVDENPALDSPITIKAKLTASGTQDLTVKINLDRALTKTEKLVRESRSRDEWSKEVSRQVSSRVKSMLSGKISNEVTKTTGTAAEKTKGSKDTNSSQKKDTNSSQKKDTNSSQYGLKGGAGRKYKTGKDNKATTTTLNYQEGIAINTKYDHPQLKITKN